MRQVPLIHPKNRGKDELSCRELGCSHLNINQPANSANSCAGPVHTDVESSKNFLTDFGRERNYCYVPLSQ